MKIVNLSAILITALLTSGGTVHLSASDEANATRHVPKSWVAKGVPPQLDINDAKAFGPYLTTFRERAVKKKLDSTDAEIFSVVLEDFAKLATTNVGEIAALASHFRGTKHSKQIVESLRQVLKENPTEINRAAAAHAVSVLGDKESVADIIPLMGSKDSNIRDIARSSLSKIGYELPYAEEPSPMPTPSN